MIKTTMDGNAAASHVSYAFSQLAVIYPITPSSPMAELADEWSAADKKNLFGERTKVVQMQSESGVAGAVHGSLTCGALTTTYTCSQGLLLMLPDMYKIAGELLPTVFHVSARALSTHALSIFGDHQDVMACRQTGFSLLASSSVQESMDLALVAHLATLKSSVPFLHFFDGFRTSHEATDIQAITYEEMKTLVDFQDIEAFQGRALTPNRPMARGTAQNGDIYFQNREAANAYYLAVPNIVQATMDKVAKLTGRPYRLFDYFGAKNAERVVVIMGSGGSVMEETVAKMNDEGENVGVIKVRLYRPFDKQAFLSALPATCKRIAVLDRTKEAGALGEPLYLDVRCVLAEAAETTAVQKRDILVVGGRYGLGSKDFTPSMCYAVFENLRSETPKNHFTVGICDDITHTSLPCNRTFVSAPQDHVSCLFYGLGSDGTVGANKNSVKIIGDNTPLHVQAYFVYDSRKSGGTTVSHLRFGKSPILSSYLIDQADFLACHNPSYLFRYDMLDKLKEGGTFLINCPHTDIQSLNAYLPAQMKRKIAQKQARLYVINATEIANNAGLKGRTSTVMQAAFFLLNPTILPYEKAIALLKKEIEKKFFRKGEEVVAMNNAAIDQTRAAVKSIQYPATWQTAKEGGDPLSYPKDEYFQRFMQPILTLQGDNLPTSAFSADGTVPTGTTRLEKHGAPLLLPQWITENCIQCNQCSFVCPHACIRPFILTDNDNAPQIPPQDFITKPAVGIPNAQFRIQVAPHDCMGCGVCANTCPAKEKALVMRPAQDLLQTEARNWEYASTLPQSETSLPRNSVKGSQFYPPLFEFSYACSGCGETPYIKLLTQLFGERMLIANATGCSSIYGGSAPSCPYTVNKKGQGPAWASSLFEDNAEFGMGMRLAYNVRKTDGTPPSVWIIGGDGWAYDIGFGGLDHVLASGENVNVLVLDSEVYSNTGGQASKSTQTGATARFAVSGKRKPKKKLGLMAMSYGYVYVAQVAMGANKQQLLTALTEAEAYDGPSLILAYSPCISHGVNMSKCMDEEKRAVDCGYWHLYRFNPDLKEQGKNLFILDSKAPTESFQDFLLGENRFAALQKTNPLHAQNLFAQAEKESKELYAFYQSLSQSLFPIK